MFEFLKDLKYVIEKFKKLEDMFGIYEWAYVGKIIKENSTDIFNLKYKTYKDFINKYENVMLCETTYYFRANALKLMVNHIIKDMGIKLSFDITNCHDVRFEPKSETCNKINIWFSNYIIQLRNEYTFKRCEEKIKTELKKYLDENNEVK